MGKDLCIYLQKSTNMYFLIHMTKIRGDPAFAYVDFIVGLLMQHELCHVDLITEVGEHGN